MKKLAGFLIDRRYVISACMLALTILCGILSAFVPVNKDRTLYLADTSRMKQGLSLINTQFPEAPEKSSIRVMFEDLSAEQIPLIRSKLESIQNVSSVSYETDSEDYNKERFTLFVVNSPFDYHTNEEKAIESAIKKDFSEYHVTYCNNGIQETFVPLWLFLFALSLTAVILLLMCRSWFEPVIILITIGIAVLINMGTNIFLPYIDEMTLSTGPIIQIVLSLDYSIILINRYLQEKGRTADKTAAMKAAFAGSAASVASSAFTTAVGLLALLFLSFKLGPELGIVLAKGVLISMICVFTVLPVLVLFSDRLLEKTMKRSLHIPMGSLARFSRKLKVLMPFVFVVLFVGFYILQGFTDITFMEKSEDPLAEIFPKENTVVLVYPNSEEDQIKEIISELEKEERITDILGFSNTLGKEMTAGEMSSALSEMVGEMSVSSGETAGDWNISEYMIRMLYSMASAEKMTIPQLFDFLCDNLMENDLFAGYFDEALTTEILNSRTALQDAASQLQGPDYSRLVITSDLPEESEETLAYIATLRQLCDTHLKESYLVGTSVMVSEMNETFRKEYLLITLITAIAVFLVVLIAFRRPILPLILTLLVQCGVFITVTMIGVFSGSLYYLALLIVQSILMGATIDYGIVFCNYYKENRADLEMTDALKAAYEGSFHTILTSGSILVLVLASLGLFTESAMISEVSVSMSIGALIAILLILFVLPGLVACSDKLIGRK